MPFRVNTGPNVGEGLVPSSSFTTIHSTSINPAINQRSVGESLVGSRSLGAIQSVVNEEEPTRDSPCMFGVGVSGRRSRLPVVRDFATVL
jgi:hypothetical protein